jgi:hypothetical protein
MLAMIRLASRCTGTHLPVTTGENAFSWDDNSINIDEVAERLQDMVLL